MSCDDCKLKDTIYCRHDTCPTGEYEKWEIENEGDNND